jgi:signal transduction histidine kinase
VAVRAAIDGAVALLPNTHVCVAEAGDVAQVVADRLWLTHVLCNLIENAVKHGRSPEPVRIVTKRSGRSCVQVSVIDTGPGIALEQQEKVFRPYVGTGSRADLTSRGLGLSIARSFVTAMGGEMWLESDGRTGTTFSFTLPIAPHAGD